MPRKPPIVIVTIILSALMLLSAIVGLFNAVQAWQYLERGEMSLLTYLWQLIRWASILLLSALTLSAGFRRPSWGHAITLAFAAFLVVMAVMAVLHPNPHPMFPIHGAAQEAGARFGRMFMIVAMLAYLWRLALGKNARGYYGQAAPRSDA
jgi:hypothetical protein